MRNREFLTSWPIRRKLLLLILVIFLPASGTVVAMGLEHRKQEIEEAKKDALLLVRSLAAQQEQVANGTKQILITLAQLPEVQRLDARACSELFREVRNRHPFYSTIGAVTPDGNLFADSTPFEPGSVNISDQKHVKDAISSLDFSVGEYFVGVVTKVRTIHYSYPVLDADKNLIAIVIAGFKLDSYDRFIKKADLPEGSAVVINDHKGLRLYRLPENDAAPLGKPPREGFEGVTGNLNEGTYERTGDDGIYRIYAFKRLSLREDSSPYLLVAVGIPKDPFVRRANLEMLRNLLVLGVAASVAISLAWFFGNLVLVKPIDQLVTTTQRLGNGEMGTRTNVPHTPDELGRLAKSFDNMASLLEKKNIERKNVEDALRESEEKSRRRVEELEKLMDLAPIAIWVAHDPQCHTITGNRTANSLYEAVEGENVSAGPAPGQTVQQRRFFQDGRELAAEELPMQYASIHGVEVRNEEVDVLLPSGRCITLLGSATPLRDSRGHIRGCIAAFMDITERKRTEAALRSLSSRLLTAQEEERKRLAGELHDSIGGSLGAIKFSLENTFNQMEEGTPPTPESIHHLIETTQYAIEEARRIYVDLRPSILDDLGVIPTIGWFCRQFQTIYSSIHVECEIGMEEDDVPEPLKIVIFRIMQEALNNIAKYSKADRVHVSLCKGVNNLELSIRDNGVGFDLNSASLRRTDKGGMGLTNMRERVELSGGAFRIESIVGQGTRISALWPCDA